MAFFSDFVSCFFYNNFVNRLIFVPSLCFYTRIKCVGEILRFDFCMDVLFLRDFVKKLVAV